VGEFKMSQAVLFGFGSVILFIVMTGALLYGIAVVQEAYKKTNPLRSRIISHYSLDEDGELW
jgi:hypothetical protein